MKIKAQKHNIAKQYASLKYCKGLDGTGQFTRNGFRYEFKVKPTPLSRIYSIRIMMKNSKPPKVYVIDPRLKELSNGRKIPHLYSQDEQRLCLYLSETRDWYPGKFLSMTIVPWTYLWLFFFEEWLYSNEWKGGGKHPCVSESEESS